MSSWRRPARRIATWFLGALVLIAVVIGISVLT